MQKIEHIDKSWMKVITLIIYYSLSSSWSWHGIHLIYVQQQIIENQLARKDQTYYSKNQMRILNRLVRYTICLLNHNAYTFNIIISLFIS